MDIQLDTERANELNPGVTVNFLSTDELSPMLPVHGKPCSQRGFAARQTTFMIGNVIPGGGRLAVKNVEWV